MYNTTPYTIGLFFILTTSLLRRGPQSKLCILTAFLMGWHWYFHKSVLIIWLSIGIGLLTMPQGRDFLNRFVRSRMLLFSIIAFTVGYSPEIAFKLGWIGNHAIGDRTSSLHLTEGFFKMASPSLMARNWYMVFRSIPTFFDADPWSRSFTSTHYLNHMENWESFPLSAGDTIGIMAAIVVISFILKLAIQSYREKKLELFILAICPFVNVLMVVLASQSSGGYYHIRRYLLPGGVVCVLWLGVCLSRNLKMRNWAVAGLLILLLAFSAFNQWKLLQLPDELVDYRKTLQQIEDAGYKYGISWYHYTHLMTGLSNEKVIFASLDYNFISPYQQQVLQQDTVVLLWPARNPPPYEFAQKLFFGEIRMKDDTVHMMPETITVLGVKYHRIAEPTITGELGWAPYRKLG